MEEQVKEALKQVLDPETGINIIDLGLVYNLQVAESRIGIELTLTTPGCPMSGTIVQAVREVLHTYFPDYTSVVDLVLLPLWSPEMITEDGRTMMGM